MYVSMYVVCMYVGVTRQGEGEGEGVQKIGGKRGESFGAVGAVGYPVLPP